MKEYIDQEIKSENILRVNASFTKHDLIIPGYPYRLRVEISNLQDKSQIKDIYNKWANLVFSQNG